MVKQIQAYVADDNSLHKTRSAAAEASLRFKLKKAINNDQFVNAVIQNGREIYFALSDIYNPVEAGGDSAFTS